MEKLTKQDWENAAKVVSNPELPGIYGDHGRIQNHWEKWLKARYGISFRIRWYSQTLANPTGRKILANFFKEMGEQAK